MSRHVTRQCAVGAGTLPVLAILERLCKHFTVYTANLTQGKQRRISQHPRGLMKTSPKAWLG